MLRRIKDGVLASASDLHMREVARGTLLVFILKFGSSILAFTFNVVLARLIGAEGAGLYFLALSITTIGAVLGAVGMNSVLLRFVSVHSTHGQWDKVRAVYILGVRFVLLASGALAVAGLILSPWMSQTLFKKPELSEPLRWMCLSIVPLALLNLNAQSLTGLRRIRDALLVQNIGVPLVCLFGIGPLAYLAGLHGVVWTYLFATSVVCAFGIWAWRKALSIHPDNNGQGRFSIKELWESSKPLYLTSIAGEALLPFAPTFFMGIWAASEDVGIFGAASRVAMILSFLLISVNNVVAPKFAELYAKRDMAALQTTAQYSAVLVTSIAAPIFLVLTIGGHWVMGLFGPGFESGVMVLSILVIAQMINVALGSSSYLLLVSGNERALSSATGLAAICLIVFLCLLVPEFGGVGAALSSVIAVTVRNVLSARSARLKTGIQLWKL